MKNLLLTLALLLTLSINVFGQKSILDYKIGDKIDTSALSDNLQITYVSYSSSMSDNADNYSVKNYISKINPVFDLNADSTINSISFKFDCKDKENVMLALYDISKNVEGSWFWNKKSDRIYKKGLDTYVEISIADNYVVYTKSKR